MNREQGKFSVGAFLGSIIGYSFLISGAMGGIWLMLKIGQALIGLECK